MRECKIRLLDRAIEDYENLTKSQTKQSKIILNSIEKTRERLLINTQYGNTIRRKLIPLEYKKYGNISRVELSNFWRLIYTIKGNETEIVIFILFIVSHKEYNKIFDYN